MPAIPAQTVEAEELEVQVHLCLHRESEAGLSCLRPHVNNFSGLFYVNLTQNSIILKEGTLVEKISPTRLA